MLLIKAQCLRSVVLRVASKERGNLRLDRARNDVDVLAAGVHRYTDGETLAADVNMGCSRRRS